MLLEKRIKEDKNPFYLKIKRLKHNHIFDIAWDKYKNKQGCYYCGRERIAASRTKSREKVKEEFSLRLKPNETLIDVYQKKRSGYNSNEWWAIINCKYHGNFEIKQGSYNRGCGCYYCGIKHKAEKMTLSKEQVEQDFLNCLKENEKLIRIYQKKSKTTGWNEW